MSEAHSDSVHGTMMAMITGHWVSQMISVIARLGLADHLEQPRPVDALASQLGVDEEALYRLARALGKVGVLTVSGRVIGLTPLGRVLREDTPGSLRHLAAFLGAPGAWRPWGELKASVETGQPTVQPVLGGSLWEHFGKHADEAEHFDRAMGNISDAGMAAVMRAYDFGSNVTICDVGGGRGSATSLLLADDPTRRAIVFDRPPVIESTRAAWADNPSRQRCTLLAGDFFESVPEGADVYLLKNIIHDWDDAEARQILANCRAAMAPGARLVLLESPLADEAPALPFILDIHMLVLFGGRERTPAEYGALLASAGLKISRVVPSGGLLTVIEATA